MTQAARVSSMLSADGVADPKARAVLSSIIRVIEERSGYVDSNSGDRFITKREFNGLATDALGQVFSGASSGAGGDASGQSSGSANGGTNSAAKLIDGLAQSIMNSLLFRKLNESIKLIDVSGLRDEIALKYGALQSGINAESTARQSADEAITHTLTTEVSRIDGTLTTTQAAIVTEQNTRATADQAITDSVNAQFSTVNGKIGSVAAGQTLVGMIQSEQQTRATQDDAMASSISAVAARIDDGNAATFSSLRVWEFEATADGWTATGASIATQATSIIVTGTGGQPQIRTSQLWDAASAYGQTPLSFPGARWDKVRARIRRAAGTGWIGTVYYTTTGTGAHGESSSYRKAVADPGAGWQVVEWDMAALTAGGADWTNGTISGLCLALGASAADTFEVDWIAVGRRGATLSEAAVVSEANSRVTRETALAKAINTIWAAVGGNQAVIEDGTLASAGTSSATASKWTQVQAAVTDPNTGNVYAAAAKQTFDTYVNSVDGTLNASYTLRVQAAGGGTTYTATAAAVSSSVNQPGQPYLKLASWSKFPTIGMYVYGPGIAPGTTVTAYQSPVVGLSTNLQAISTAAGAYSFSTAAPVVGGFGAVATGGAGSSQGPSIDVGVVANRFWLAAPGGSYDPAADYSTANNFPFIALTTATTINGVTYQPGVYLKRAVIGEASIDTANIRDLAVGTLKIGANAVTVPVSAALATSGNVAVGSDTSDFGGFSNSEGSLMGTYTMASPGIGSNVQQNQVIVAGRVGLTSGSGSENFRIGIFADGSLIADSGWAPFTSPFFNVLALDSQGGTSTRTYTVRIKGRNYTGAETTSAAGTMLILGAKR